MANTDSGMAAETMESIETKFRLEEFKILHDEVELRATEQRTMERNVLIGSAAIYGFLIYPKVGTLPDADKPFLLLAWYLPCVLNFLALIRWRESVKMIAALALYLQSIERNGWETFLQIKRKGGRFPIISNWYGVFWSVVCVGPLVIASFRAPLFAYAFNGTDIAVIFLLAMAATAGIACMVFSRDLRSQSNEGRPY